jgi:probable HAF family extracellular repeat protein
MTCVIGCSQASPFYSVTDIGFSDAQGINDSGQVVGFSGGVTFLWTPGIGVTELGTFGGNYSIPMELNNKGQIVGYYGTADNMPHAFLWSPDSGMTDLGVFGGDESFGFGINDSEQVVGNAGPGHAFLWTSASGMTDLGSLGGIYAAAFGINADGQVVGFSTLPGDSRNHAFRWVSGVGMSDLGTLGGANSEAVAINNLGQVVGTSEIVDYGTSSVHPFLWTQEAGMIDLGFEGRANSINDSGMVVGSVGAFGYGPAFLWTAGEGFVDLNSRIPAGSDLNLRSATGINNSGQIIGYGVTSAGAAHAFLLTPITPPPEPPSNGVPSIPGSGLLLLSVLLLVARAYMEARFAPPSGGTEDVPSKRK